MIGIPDAALASAVFGVTTVAPLQKKTFFGFGSTRTNFFFFCSTNAGVDQLLRQQALPVVG